MKKKPIANIVVKNDEEIPTEIIASSIQAIADGMKKIRAGRLTDYAIVLLIQASTGLARKDIQTVLNVMGNLESMYLKKKPT